MTQQEINMRRSFSWNRDFFTSDGFLDAEELSNMIEGGVDDDVDHELQKFEEIENLEAKLFQEIETSTQKSTQTSVKKNSQAKSAKTKSTEPPAKSPPSCGGFGGKKVKSPARRSMSSKTSTGITTKNKVGPVNTRVSRTPPASPGSSGSSTSSMFLVKQRPKRSSSAPRRSSTNNEKPSPTNATKNEKTTINKSSPVNTRMSRTPPASPGSSSTKRSNSAPRRSSINNEKPSSINTRRNNEKPLTMNKASPVNTRLSRTPPSQGSKRSSSAPRRSSLNNDKPLTKNDEYKTKNKVTPANSYISISKTLPSSPVSSSPTFCNNQRSRRSNSVPRRSSVNNEKGLKTNESGSDEWKFSKPEVVLIPKTQSSISLKTKPPPVLSHPTILSESSSSSSSSSTSKVNQKSKTPVRNGKQSAASRSETMSPNGSKIGRNLSPKTVSRKTNTTATTTTSKPTRKQSSAKVKVKAKSASGVSRGAEDIILVSPEVMDIKGKLNALKMEISMQKKLNHDEKGESSSIIQMNNQTKSKQRI